MKKTTLILLLLVSSAMAEVKWASSYTTALSQATKEKKNVLVMLSKEDCPACEYMEEVVFEENLVEETVAKNFVAVHLDIHTNTLPQGLGYMGTPTFYLLNAKGEKLKRYDGAANIPTFIGFLTSIKK